MGALLVGHMHEVPAHVERLAVQRQGTDHSVRIHPPGAHGPILPDVGDIRPGNPAHPVKSPPRNQPPLPSETHA